jgi:hypothetical protein
VGKNPKVERIAIKTKTLQANKMAKILIVEAIYQKNLEFHQLSIPAKIRKILRIKSPQLLIIYRVKIS